LVLGLIFSSCAHSTITSEQAAVRVRAGAYLLDVRSPAEFAEGHLSGARNVPVEELEGTLSSLPVDRSREIVLVGARGPRAREILRRAGFAKIESVR
jgi:rhodanese-related sulfurtransferase